MWHPVDGQVGQVVEHGRSPLWFQLSRQREPPHRRQHLGVHQERSHDATPRAHRRTRTSSDLSVVREGQNHDAAVDDHRHRASRVDPDGDPREAELCADYNAEMIVLRVTDRGWPRAMVMPLPASDQVDRGLAEGWIRRERVVPPPDVQPVVAPPGPSGRDLLDDDRGE
ncbi:hypothetical protein BH24ACT12_BH24ACT12_28820 [soil metagenome]